MQEDERVRMVVYTPYNPQHVAQKEQPESPVALKLSLRPNHPCGDHGHQHRRPLDGVKNIHALELLLATFRRALLRATRFLLVSQPLVDTLANKLAHVFEFAR